MKKGILLLMILSGLLLKAKPQASFQQYYYMAADKATLVAPILTYQTQNWHLEGRYNYEASKTGSVYAGRTFKREGKFTYSIAPMAGIVAGSLNGGSIAANVELGYKKLNFSSQQQYTFSVQNRLDNFSYGWTDLSYQISDMFSAGLSVQQTKTFKEQPSLEKGLFAQISYKKWEVPVYVFSPGTKHANFVLGINFEIPLKNTSPGNIPALNTQRPPVFLAMNAETIEGGALGTLESYPEKSEQPQPFIQAPVEQVENRHFMLVGSFSSKQDASDALGKLSNISGVSPILSVTGNEYNIRATGFSTYKDAQACAEKIGSKELQNTYAILPYQLMNVLVAKL